MSILEGESVARESCGESIIIWSCYFEWNSFHKHKMKKKTILLFYLIILSEVSMIL